MAMKTNPDGTIDVRVVLTVTVDPVAWVRDMMDENPDELLQKEVRRDVKTWVRNAIASAPFGNERAEAIRAVHAEGLYDVARG